MWQITRSANKNYSHKNDLKLVAGIGKFLLYEEWKKKIDVPNINNTYPLPYNHTVGPWKSRK